MNMNDQEWNDNWDEEPDEDDEFNDFGSDVDANNDETFDNAAEWNEDEHEELIARDSILSHTIRSNNNNSNNTNRHVINSTTLDAANLVNHINFVGPTSSNNHNIQRSSPSNSSSNNGNRNPTEFCFMAVAQDKTPTWGPAVDRGLFPPQERPKPQNLTDHTDPMDMYQVIRNAERYIQSMSQQERTTPEQNQDFMGLLSQQDRPSISRPPQIGGKSGGERILTVDELEKQLLRTSLNTNREQPPQRAHHAELSKRAGWSPFGGKELFTTQEQQLHAQMDVGGPNIMAHGRIPQSTSVNIDQQRQIFIQEQMLQQQQQMLQQQQLLQQITLMKQQQIQAEQRLMAQNPQCFTVEELERQLLANRTTNSQNLPQNLNQIQNLNQNQIQNLNLNLKQEQNQNQSETHESPKTNARIQPTPERSTKIQDRQHNNHKRRDGERSDRLDFDRQDRDGRENRHNHKDRRDTHRDNNRDHRQRQRGPIIVPPQVQLSVIEKGKNLHPLASSQGDEFLQDRVPTMKDGFLMKRHSAVARGKPNHDGVLTEKERNWLIQIQEKIQADYDDNMDQDYYYLLYFNRTSIPNEKTQNSRGPGVPDRRFIPRERLLYDSST